METKAQSPGFFTKIGRMNESNLLFTITVVIFVLMYVGAIVFQGGGFLSAQTFFNILNDNAALIIGSLGMSVVMITGGIDISIGGVAALVSMSCAVYLDKAGGNLVVSLLLAIGIGLLFGLVQGFLVAYLDIQPFIVSLAGMFFARGMTTIVNSEPFNVAHEGFMNLKDTHIIVPFLGRTNRKGFYIDAYVEVGVIVAIVLVVLMFILLRWSRLGRNFYAVGGNANSALMLGINVKKTRFLSHVICSVLAGIGGFVYFVHVGSGSPSHATGMEMDAIACSIIGGTMLTGGVGNILGTLFGVLSLGTIKNIVASAGLGEAWWTGITTAGMLCLFLIIQSVVMAVKGRAAAK
ncbi:MAG: sugar ABC transporter permease YjfF [Eubacterium sp.]|nr:sugar ABC transporter permease YjfF [Eubacterium sp.]